MGHILAAHSTPRLASNTAIRDRPAPLAHMKLMRGFENATHAVPPVTSVHTGRVWVWGIAPRSRHRASKGLPAIDEPLPVGVRRQELPVIDLVDRGQPHATCVLPHFDENRVASIGCVILSKGKENCQDRRDEFYVLWQRVVNDKCS